MRCVRGPVGRVVTAAATGRPGRPACRWTRRSASSPNAVCAHRMERRAAPDGAVGVKSGARRPGVCRASGKDNSAAGKRHPEIATPGGGGWGDRPRRTKPHPRAVDRPTQCSRWHGRASTPNTRMPGSGPDRRQSSRPHADAIAQAPQRPSSSHVEMLAPRANRRKIAGTGDLYRFPAVAACVHALTRERRMRWAAARPSAAARAG